MDPELLCVLIVLVLLAAGGIYWGFFSRGRTLLTSRLQAGALTLIFLVIPAVLLVLAEQRHAVARLAREGIVPHPSIENAVGVAAGKGPGPLSVLLRRAGLRGSTWLFDLKGSPENVLAFYRNPAHAPGWTLTEDGPAMLILRRGPETMSISARKGLASRQISYTVSDSRERP